jgi:hypothetical protein
MQQKSWEKGSAPISCQVAQTKELYLALPIRAHFYDLKLNLKFQEIGY